MTLRSLTLLLNAGQIVADQTSLAEPQHDVLGLMQRLQKCDRGSLEAVLLAAIVAQKIAVEDLRPTW